MIEEMRTIDKNGWTHPGCEFISGVEQIKTTDKNGGTFIQAVSASPVLELLTRMGEHIQAVSASNIWLDQNHLQEWVNMHPGCECLSSLWWNENHWQEWVNMHPGCEYLSSVWLDQTHWWEWVNTSRMWVPLQCLTRSKSLTRMGEHAFRKWVLLQYFLTRSEPLMRTCPECECLQCLTGLEPLNSEHMTTHLACECLSSVWPVQSHWTHI